MRKFLFCNLLVLISHFCMAGGYALYNMNAAAHGMAHAYVCRVNDASAVFYNPAALTRIDRNDIYLSGNWISTSGDFSSDALDGITFKQVDQDHFPPNGYYAHRLSERFVFGLGSYIPFAFSTEWPVQGLPALVSRKSELRTFFVTPSLGFRPTPNISIGGGLDVIYADTSLSQSSRFPFSTAPERTLNAHDYDVGFNLGALLDTYSNWVFAVTYKSKVNLEMEGDTTYATAVPVAAGIPGGKGRVAFPLPSSITFGASTTFENLLFEGDLIYTNWGAFETFHMDFDNPSFIVNSVNLPRQYENTWALRLGAEYRFTDNLTLRGGYLHDQTPVPDRSVDPLLPDATRNGVTMGFTYATGRWNFDVGYMTVSYDTRTVPRANSYPFALNSFVSGSYTNSADLLAFGIGYKY